MATVSTNANFVDASTANGHICPSVGHILTGHYAAADVWEGESIPCTPGQQVIIITWPGSTGDGSSSVTSGGGSDSGSGASGTGTGFDAALNFCVSYSYKADPITGAHLILQNNCSVAARVWFYSSPQIHGAATINPGDADNTYAAQDAIAAAGGVSIYACPAGDIARMADGTQASMGRNNPYDCSRK
jgi:hypothetical protein